MRIPLDCLASAALAAGATLLLASSTPSPERTPEDILRDHVADFRTDRAAAVPRTFGISVDGDDGGDWTVVVTGEQADDGTWGVELVDGFPTEPTFFYTVDAATLADVDTGRINALTAQGKALPTDITPMDQEWMDGAEVFDVNPFSFHFWTRGFPERVPFRRELSRTVHSSNNVVFYYQEGLRSAWCSLAKGQGANNGLGIPLQAPFPKMIFVVAGRAKGSVAGRPVVASKGEMIFIPPNTPHEWWNEDDEEAEVILIMFGEGA